MLGNSDYALVRTTAPTWLHADYRTGHSSAIEHVHSGWERKAEVCEGLRGN